MDACGGTRARQPAGFEYKMVDRAGRSKVLRSSAVLS